MKTYVMAQDYSTFRYYRNAKREQNIGRLVYISPYDEGLVKVRGISGKLIILNNADLLMVPTDYATLQNSVLKGRVVVERDTI